MNRGAYSDGLKSFVILALVLFSARIVLAEEPALENPQRLVFVWNGDEVSTLQPMSNIADVISRYEARGLRVMQSIGLPSLYFTEMIQNDRKSKPDDYDRRQVTLILHGRWIRNLPAVKPLKNSGQPMQAGLMPKSEAESANVAPEPQAVRIKEDEIILAFLEGIGTKTKGEVIYSECFFGRECFPVNLSGTLLESRLSRLIVPKKPSLQDLSQLVPAATPEFVLDRLYDVLASMK